MKFSLQRIYHDALTDFKTSVYLLKEECFCNRAASARLQFRETFRHAVVHIHMHVLNVELTSYNAEQPSF